MVQNPYLCVLVSASGGGDPRYHDEKISHTSARRAALGSLRRHGGPDRSHCGERHRFDSLRHDGRARRIHLPRQGGTPPLDHSLHTGAAVRRRIPLGGHRAVRRIGRPPRGDRDGRGRGALQPAPLGVRRGHHAARRASLPAHVAVEHGPRLRPGHAAQDPRPPLRGRGMGADY